MADEIQFKKTMDFVYGEPRELVPGVTRIVANNPGPFTYKGSNTYIVGMDDGLAVIDPGPADAAHIQAILAYAGKRSIAYVVITHTHRDHTDGMPALLAATGARTAGYGRRVANRGSKSTSPSGSEFVDQDFVPDVPLLDGEALEGRGWSLTALFTPGHAPDHLCFALGGTGADGVLFSGDHVMGWNTSVVAPPEGHMGDYIRSLEKLNARSDRLYLPGHGGKVEDAQRLAKAYLLHRRMREQAILDCIKEGTNTARSIVPVIYKGLDSRLVNAAALSVLAHVEHLSERGLVRFEGALSGDLPVFPA